MMYVCMYVCMYICVCVCVMWVGNFMMLKGSIYNMRTLACHCCPQHFPHTSEDLQVQTVDWYLLFPTTIKCYRKMVPN